MNPRHLVAAAAVCAVSTAATAQDIAITIENPLPGGATALTPFWIGVHNGSFDVFDPNALSSTLPGITQIAETGGTGDITARFDTEQPNGTQTTFQEPNGPPVFSPGESATIGLTVANPGTYRFLAFGSMVVPSNDLFIAREGVEIFDSNGNFLGPITIEVLGSQVWDNGSEVNDITDGPAFVAGQDAAAGTAESNNPSLLFDDPTAANAYLSTISSGTVDTPIGVISQTFGPDDVVARITIVPEPAAGATLLAASGLVLRRRRR